MKTRVSTKGQVVLPSPIRRKLGLRAGDPLDAKVDGDRIVLTPSKARSQKVRIIEDPVTGLPVLTAVHIRRRSPGSLVTSAVG
jgi:AbrB family looped-hinge helix DNA binding protein